MEENESNNRTTNQENATQCSPDPKPDPQIPETSPENETVLSDSFPETFERQVESLEEESQKLDETVDRDLLFPPNSDPDSDPGSPICSQKDERGELSRLRNELNELKKTIAMRDSLFARLGSEFEDFSVLYPDTSLSEIPDEVWSDVKKGIPLAASFALLQKRQAKLEEIAEDTNRRNRSRSSGSLESPDNDYFSPDEVRSMSREDVRKNYSKIMSSMSKWH